MRKIIFLIILFLIFTAIVCFCPVVTQWDRIIIIFVQDLLKNLPIAIPIFLSAYTIDVFLPLIIGDILFLKKKLFIDMALFSSAPLVAYLLNKVIKIILHRPRPPVELQITYHPDGFSYVSNHAFITCALWGLIIYYLIKYCSNKFVRYIGIFFSVLWMAIVGFSRIWLGVHNPTDVLGGYLLSFILVFIYVKIIRTIEGQS